MMANFAISDGCIVMPPTPNQRFAPLISVPTASTATSSNSVTTTIGKESLPSLW